MTFVPRSMLLFVILVLAPALGALEKEEPLFADPFTDKLKDGWTWVREDPKGWRLDKGTLVIRTSVGGLWMKDNNGRNILLRTPPKVKSGKLAVEVLVDIEPTNQYENAGLIWYYDDDNYVIMVKEKIDKEILVQIVQEQNGKPKAGFHKKFEGKSVWVRMEVEGDKITGRYRETPKEDWVTVGQCMLPKGGEPKVGLTTAYAAQGAMHFSRFTNLRIMQVKE